MPNQIVTDLEQLASKMAADKDLKVVGLLLITKNKPMTLQIQIRQKDGTDASLDDCALLSIPMGDAIEDSKLIKEPYVLEISSPGLTDELSTDKEFETFKGFPIEVTFKNKENTETLKSGLLHSRSKDHLVINIKGKMSKIPRMEVIQVRLTTSTG